MENFIRPNCDSMANVTKIVYGLIQKGKPNHYNSLVNLNRTINGSSRNEPNWYTSLVHRFYLFEPNRHTNQIGPL